MNLVLVTLSFKLLLSRVPSLCLGGIGQPDLDLQAVRLPHPSTPQSPSPIARTCELLQGPLAAYHTLLASSLSQTSFYFVMRFIIFRVAKLNPQA